MSRRHFGDGCAAPPLTHANLRRPPERSRGDNAMKRRQRAVLPTVFALVALSSSPAPGQDGNGKCPSADPPEIREFTNCTAMWNEWPSGVRAQGGTYCKKWNANERDTFQKNKSKDRDDDNWACEKETYEPKPHVAVGFGAAARHTFGGPSVTAGVVDQEGIVQATADRDEPVRPVATAAFLWPCGGKKKR